MSAGAGGKCRATAAPAAHYRAGRLTAAHLVSLHSTPLPNLSQARQHPLSHSIVRKRRRDLLIPYLQVAADPLLAFLIIVYSSPRALGLAPPPRMLIGVRQHHPRLHRPQFPSTTSTVPSSRSSYQQNTQCYEASERAGCRVAHVFRDARLEEGARCGLGGPGANGWKG
ncbi:hypothetical protein PLICRDRAFT_239905 [Plicaturopsis crispa FD-325 SS-3]|nr:hypothetical protein PLICRDRAFT_239905 [Plicaturopsis crispa FD-325 SS-3]